MLGSELWESRFDGLLGLVKKYIVVVWELRTHELYESDSESGLLSLPWERSGKFSQNGKFGQNGMFSQNGKFGQNGKFSQNGMSGQKGQVHLGPNVSSSAHVCGRVVNDVMLWQQYEYYYFIKESKICNSLIIQECS